MLSDAIPDDMIFIWTQNINGAEFKKRTGEKRITFGLAADAFERSDGVGDLIKNKLIGLVICNRDVLSEGARELVPVKEKRKTNESNKK